MKAESASATGTASLESATFCRLCIECITEQTLVFPHSSTAALFERISKCTGVRLENVPGISQWICDVCTSQLVICERFIKQCREADQKLFEWRLKRPDAGELETFSHDKSVLLAASPVHSPAPEAEPHKSNATTDATTKRQKATKGRKCVPKNQCQVCGSMQQNLKQHMLVHTGEKKHVCPFCSRAFSQKGNLTHHINQHTGEHPYKCDKCDKAYTDPQSLRSHKLVHTDERKWHCEVCGDTFKYRNSLVAHVRSHKQDKPYVCNECGNKFTYSSALKKHMRTHTGERPYSCTVCKKSFKSSSNLSLHKVSHTKERRFQCDLCKCWFSYKNVLKKHMDIHVRERYDNVPPIAVAVSEQTKENGV